MECPKPKIIFQNSDDMEKTANKLIKLAISMLNFEIKNKV